MCERIHLNFVAFYIFLLFLMNATNAFSEQTPIIKAGDYFPEITLEAPKDPKQLSYLGIPENKVFTIKDIKADLVLVEIMNINCPSCQKQAPINNKLFSLIESPPEAKGRIKMIAIAVGCLDVYMKQFVDHFKTPYPIFQDPKFVVYDAIGKSPIPLAIFVRQDAEGKRGIVAGTHQGFDEDYKGLFKEMQTLVGADLASILEKKKKAESKVVYVKPILEEKELRAKIKVAFTEEGDNLTRFEKINLQTGLNVYTGLVQKDGQAKRLFAAAISRPAPCDVCHDLHFIYVFETTGKILQLIPLQLTKYGNEPWDEADVDKMRKRIVGRYISSPFDFDPKVDAVTSATITSSIIFKSLNEGITLFKELKERGLL